MQFHSFIYLFAFLPIAFGLYSIFRRSIVGKIVILIASYIFYAWVHVWYLIPLLCTSLLDYAIGLRMEAAPNEVTRRRWLVFSLTANLGLLAAFKYAGWVSQLLHEGAMRLGLPLAVPIVSVPLPPGISFYTFQSMTYTIGVYWMQHPPAKNLLDYLNFVTFFPQLVAGPIQRFRNLWPQISATRERLSSHEASAALFLILWGMFQKTVLADNFGGLVEFTTRTFPPQSNVVVPGMGLIFMYAFAGQIYCDFSAYTNIARGTAKFFNIELTRNFLTPYFATNPSDFWSRWHISLSSWLRDYLFTPLNMAWRGRRGQTYQIMISLFITMLAIGLWHGAGLFFIIWGAYHGFLYVVYQLFPLDRFLTRHLGRLGKALSIVIFFHLVCIGWIFFRSSPQQAGTIVESVLRVPAMLSSLHLLAGGNAIWDWITRNWVFSVLLWGLCIYATPLLIAEALAYRVQAEFGDLWTKMPTWVRIVVILLLIYGIVFFAYRQGNEFIYFAF